MKLLTLNALRTSNSPQQSIFQSKRHFLCSNNIGCGSGFAAGATKVTQLVETLKAISSQCNI